MKNGLELCRMDYRDLTWADYRSRTLTVMYEYVTVLECLDLILLYFNPKVTYLVAPKHSQYKNGQMRRVFGRENNTKSDLDVNMLHPQAFLPAISGLIQSVLG